MLSIGCAHAFSYSPSALGLRGAHTSGKAAGVHRHLGRTVSPVCTAQEGDSRRVFLRDATAGAALCLSQPAWAGLFGSDAPKKWERSFLPDVEVNRVLFDIEFDDTNPDHGWLVGTRGTFLETFDGGKSWKPKVFTDLDTEEEINYRYEVISFKGSEGWIIGKPTILLHTTDSGKSWERLPFSTKLPGDPVGIVALGEGKAELSTSAGAIYTTTNAGRNWKAEVKETIDATLNRVSSSGVSGASYYSGQITSVQRDAQGSYLAVSSRGNFYLTWRPGQDFWVPHNRNSNRRISNMGFLGPSIDEGLWLTSKGGGLSITNNNGEIDLLAQELPFQDKKINTKGYGLLDVASRTNQEVWAVGGGGKIFVSSDGGTTWKADDSGDDQPANFYRLKWFGNNKGFILGSGGVLMRYVG